LLDSSDITDPGELAEIRVRMRLLLEQPSLVPTYLMINHEVRTLVQRFVAGRAGLPPTHPYPLLVAAAASSAWDVALHAWSSGHSQSLAELRRSAFAQLSMGIHRTVT
jgi:hypothetical protein